VEKRKQHAARENEKRPATAGNAGKSIMSPFWSQIKTYRYGIALSALGLVALGATLLPEALWADMFTPIHSEKPGIQKPKVITDADLIRVGISDDAMTTWEVPSVTLSATGPFTVSDKPSGKVLMTMAGPKRLKVSRSSQGFWLQAEGATRLGPYWNPLVVHPSDLTSRLTVPSITRRGVAPSYRGDFELVAAKNAEDKLTLINVLPMQEYLKAVVPNELPFRYGLETVKAQAVAARNYALRPREKSWTDFDICDSQYCQAYYGAHTEDPKVTDALAQTQGLVALYNGEPILALYSSSHAGVADSYADVFSDPKTNQFPAPPLSYLSGGADRGPAPDLSTDAALRQFLNDPQVFSYDRISPMFRWHREWTRAQLEAEINRNLPAVSLDPATQAFVSPQLPKGQTIGQLQSISVLTRSPAGKIMRLAITGSRGTWVLSKEFVIRKVLQHGGRFLPSATAILDPVKDAKGNVTGLRAIGGGFGHGVGMSQIGASAMARSGTSFVSILQHYYKGVAIGPVPLSTTSLSGQETRFFVTQTKGTLVINNPNPQPIYFTLNDTRQMVPPSASPIRLPVSKWLKPNQVNRLSVEPLDANFTEPSRLWLELYAPI